MKSLRWGWAALTATLLGYGFYQAMYVAPTEATMGNIQRIFYWHLSSWLGMVTFFAVNLIVSIVYLASRRSNPLRALKADALAVASAEMGVVFCTVGLVTGSLWARPVWGIWWTWDARLTSTLILYLIYISYLLLRHFAAGEQMRSLAAVVAIFGYLDVPIVYMSTRWWRTQHPGPVIGGGGLDPSMWPALLTNMAAWLAWGILLTSLRYTVERRRQLAEQRAALRALESTLELTK